MAVFEDKEKAEAWAAKARLLYGRSVFNVIAVECGYAVEQELP